MGYWFPALVDSCSDQDFFKIPRTRVAKVPLPMLQLTRQDYAMLTPTTLKIVNDWAYQAFQLDKSKEYFIKTGTYSSKFDFRNAYVHSAKEVRAWRIPALYPSSGSADGISTLSSMHLRCVYNK